MNENKSLKINIIMNAVLMLSSFIFPLIAFPYVSRVLLPEGTGKVAFANSIVTYFNLFAQLGIPTYGIRACARVRDDKEKLTKTVHELFFISFIMCILTTIALLSMVPLVPRMAAEKTLYVVLSFSIVLTALGMEWFFRALERYVYITVRSVIFKLIALAGMLLLVKAKEDYVIYAAMTIFAASASNILNFIYAHRFLSGKFYFGKYSLKEHLKPIMVFFAQAIATTIYTNLDSAMLGFIKNDTEVGYYNAAVMIKNMLVNLVTSVGVVLLPRASYYIEKKMFQEFEGIIKRSMGFMFMVAAPMVLYFILYAKEGVLILSGNAYLGAVLPMQIIMPTLLLIALTNVLGIQVLIPKGREVWVLYSEIAGALTDVVLNLILIPRYGAAGAAGGTLVAEIVVLLVQMYALRADIKNFFSEVEYFKLILANLIAVVLIFIVKRYEFGNWINLIISAIVFFGAYLLALILSKSQNLRSIRKS